MKTFFSRPLLLSAICVFSCLPASVFASARPGDLEKEIINKQTAYFESLKNKNSAAAAAVLADDYVGVYSGGIFDRDREIKDLKDFAAVLSEYRISEQRVRFPNVKTAIITFRLHVKVVVEGKDFFEDDNIACVWTKRKKSWVLSSQAAVKVKSDQ
ncbi:MAG: nuclear transport factor 2 family protein [Pyrinomonadaceae bacterium]